MNILSTIMNMVSWYLSTIFLFKWFLNKSREAFHRASIKIYYVIANEPCQGLQRCLKRTFITLFFSQTIGISALHYIVRKYCLLNISRKHFPISSVFKHTYKKKTLQNIEFLAHYNYNTF
jgi:hypothetical protein